MAKVYILGLNHQIQFVAILSIDSATQGVEQQQKGHFRTFLESVVKRHEVEFIAEEANAKAFLDKQQRVMQVFYDAAQLGKAPPLPEGTIAQQVASNLSCSYEDIDMPPEERKRRNIPGDYLDQTKGYSATDVAKWVKEHEQYLLERAVSGKRDAESVLILCGRCHTRTLASLLRQAGHSVETHDLRQELWYLEDWACTLGLGEARSDPSGLRKA
jgi:hypothetical protein